MYRGNLAPDSTGQGYITGSVVVSSIGALGDESGLGSFEISSSVIAKGTLFFTSFKAAPSSDGFAFRSKSPSALRTIFTTARVKAASPEVWHTPPTSDANVNRAVAFFYRA
jgi:hypothetical protein